MAWVTAVMCDGEQTADGNGTPRRAELGIVQAGPVVREGRLKPERKRVHRRMSNFLQ